MNDDEVLADIAMQFGFTHDEALAEMRDARELATTHELATWAAQQGIQGVPFFIFANKFAMSGCQPEAVFEQALQKALDESA